MNKIILQTKLKKLCALRKLSTSGILRWKVQQFPELDIDYICDTNNLQKIEENIQNRKGIGDISLVNKLKVQLDQTNLSASNYEQTKKQFYEELLKIPNTTHPAVFQLGDDTKVVKLVNKKPEFTSKPLEFPEITKRLRLVRTDQLGNLSGSRSYFFTGEMAELEQSLISYFVGKLIKNGFQLVSVPDILHRDIIESCGMNTKGIRTQVYALDPEIHGADLCLSGTSEMALAGLLMNKTLNLEELPMKLLAVSRCFRAETSSIAEERGIYRVHEFTKVEMFVVTTPETSDETLEEIREIQEKNFESLGVHFQVLDMPGHELGAQAYRKYDIEAWMPGRGMYGEISSSSNCTDYQSRRLGIKYRKQDGEVGFVHTLNGTACAVPRLLIALVESGQNSREKNVSVPEVLWPFMNGKKAIGKQKQIPDLKLIKHKK